MDYVVVMVFNKRGSMPEVDHYGKQVSEQGFTVVPRESVPADPLSLLRLVEAGQVRFDGQRPGVLEISKVKTLGASDALLAVHGFALDVFRTIEPTAQFSKAWIQTSTAETVAGSVNTVPFLPHLDYQRYLKAMWYLVDISESNGAMRVAGERPEGNELRRQALTPGYKERGDNVFTHRPDSDFVPIEAPAGSLLCFDTNVPHHAGRVIEGEAKRVVVRFDFAVERWFLG